MFLYLAPFQQPFTLQAFTIANASPKYSVRILVTGKEGADGVPDMIQGSGKVTIKSKATGAVIQTISMKSIAVFTKQLSTSVGKDGREPSMYDDSYSLVFEDFNFDGRQDLAICNGLNSGYGGPSYDVYLFDPKKSKFIKSPTLSTLASEHLGLFEIDWKAHALLVYDKSGAAWHKETSYRLVHNRLVKVGEMIDDATGSKEVLTTRKLVGSKWKVTKKVSPLPKNTGE